MWAIVLLIISNIFMNYAWYGHLHHFKDKGLIFVILLSWGIAFFEYCFQVPANRLGSQHFSMAQLKIIQEALSLLIFLIMSITVLGQSFSKNYVYASLCICAAVLFIFQDGNRAPA